MRIQQGNRDKLDVNRYRKEEKIADGRNDNSKLKKFIEWYGIVTRIAWLKQQILGTSSRMKGRNQMIVILVKAYQFWMAKPKLNLVLKVERNWWWFVSDTVTKSKLYFRKKILQKLVTDRRLRGGSRFGEQVKWDNS